MNQNFVDSKEVKLIKIGAYIIKNNSANASTIHALENK